MLYIYLMNAYRNIFLLTLVTIIFNACKNDLELNAPYKEKPSIYAVLNPQEKIQMIRINKVFLGESDANAMAQIADSINYKPGELTVTLTRFVNGNQVDASPGKQTITFRDSMVQAVAGTFNSNQRVYVSSDKLFVNGDYVLTVYNNTTKNTFKAKSTAIDSVKPNYRPFIGVTYPAPPNTPVNDDNYIKYDNPNASYTIRYSPNEAKIYQVVMRLHYYDSIGQGASNNYAYVDFPFTNQYSKDLQGQATFAPTFRGQDVYNAAASGLSRNSMSTSAIQGRRMYKIQFFIYSSTQDYIDYLQFASPSLSIAQDKPLFSNFDDQAAIGIFTFRSRASVMKEMDNSFISQFATNKSTCSYKFYTASLNLPGCQ